MTFNGTCFNFFFICTRFFFFPFRHVPVFLFHFFVFISAQCEQSLWVQMWQVCVRVHVWKCFSLLFLRSWRSEGADAPLQERQCWSSTEPPQVPGLLMLPQAVHSRHANTEIKSNNQSLSACLQVDVYFMHFMGSYEESNMVTLYFNPFVHEL